MKHQHFQKIVRTVVLALLVFVLSTEPALVAAKTLQKDPHAEAVNNLVNGGDAYLDSASKLVVESMELLNSLNAIQGTPINQISETYISDAISKALNVAEQCSIALGSVNVMADGIEKLGGNLPVAMNVNEATGAGIPQEMRDELSAMGIPLENIDQVSNSAADLLSTRQGGIPASVQADLLNFGFTQSQIDQIAATVPQRGLANTGLTTRLDQFRATQDELADTRSGMVILAVQLLGYQIAARQASGLASRAVTDDELQMLAEDELRLLVHAAHLNAMWGSDPSTEVGEGDWWFIEHYAGRAAERLQAITVESQNRGLVAELFVLHQMKMLAVSARTGDAEYAKNELDRLAGLLSHQLNATAYYQERQTPGVVEMAWARVTATPALRETSEWSVPEGVAKNAKLVIQERFDSTKVENLAEIIGDFEEPNETNNTGGLLIAAGLSFFDQVTLDVVQTSLDILAVATPENLLLWVEAILTGNTDNPALLAANVVLSLIPVIGVIPDIVTLAVDPSYFTKALSIFGIIGSIGDIIALIPGLQGVGGASFVGDAVSAVVKTLFKQADTVFRAVLDGMKLADSFDVVADLVKTVVKIVGNALGSSLDEVITTISNIFTGSRSLWGDFVAFTRRAGADLLLKLGFDEGSALVGRILNLGVDLSDEALVAVKKVSDDLIAAGIDLSDEAAGGLGKFAKSMDADDLQRFVNRLGGVCGVGLKEIPVYKLAAPVSQCDPDILKKALANYNSKFNDLMKSGAQNILDAVGPESLADVVIKYGSDPDNLTDATKLFEVLGDPAISKDVISTAFKTGNDLGNKGPEALRALTGWDDKFKGILKNNSALAEELAQRAGKDAVALAAVDEMVRSGVLNPILVDEIAGNSVVTGGNNFYVLGKWTESGLEGGYAKVARDLDATYFYPHPDVYKKLEALPDQTSAWWWAIDSSAIQMGKGSTFKYTLEGTPLTDKVKDEAILEQLVSGGNPGADEFNRRLVEKYGDEIPDRMKELQILISENYQITQDALGLYVFDL